jgi:iron complex transport system substrate-binding protein
LPIVAIEAQPRTAFVTAEEVVERQPGLIIGSWCGKKFRPERVLARRGFDRTPGGAGSRHVRDQILPDLAAGPAALTDGVADIQKIIGRWARTLR